MKNFSMVLVSTFLCFLLVEVPFALRANAGMIATSQAVSELTQFQNRKKVDAFFSRQEVQKELVKFGVSPNEASTRIASLSDSEVQKMAGQIDQGTVGGDEVVISISTILLIIIILLLLHKI